MVDSDALYVLYLLVVRIGTIVAGIAAIRYGYKLFAAGVFKADPDAAKTELSGRVGDYEFKFATAAPGSVLALFGALIITMTMLAAPPERSRDAVETVQDQATGVTRTVESHERMRGEGGEFEKLTQTAAELQQAGATVKALQAYEQALRLAAEPMHELAKIYLELERFEDAKTLAQVPVMLNPSQPNYRFTLDTIKGKLGE